MTLPRFALVLLVLSLLLVFSAGGSLLPGPPVTASAAGKRVGSIADSRFSPSDAGWTLDGSQMAYTRAKLLAQGYTVTDVSAPITAGVLANFDIFFIGWLVDSSSNAFTAAELNAFQTWVTGGGVLIVTCDDPQHDAVCSFFGYPSVQGAVNPMVPLVSHPIFNGPCGNVTTFLMTGNQGFFTSTLGANVLAVDSTAPTPRPIFLERFINLGRVILFSDVDIISGPFGALSPGIGIVNNNDRVYANLFAYAASLGACPQVVAPATPTSSPTVTATPILAATPVVAARPPQIGAFLGPTSGSERNLANAGIVLPGATPQTQAPVAAGAATVVRPPSTGDAGLGGGGAAGFPAELVLLLPLTLLCVGALRAAWIREKR